ncbi:hypothetical protein [Thalassobacillus sp. CUG 92003]|uniref:hypothetical protein n=1 Tax=Thalassobacillus sp. CUG 92003 TaxID=2736641 RepID=UPI0021028F9A|nr:hypothetical protein [Thalassobacillus sp. CUG 92003]
MDRPKVLEQVYDIVPEGGGVAIIDNYEPNKQLTPWEEQLNDVITRWYGTERRAGKTTYHHPTVDHEEVIAQSKFDVEVHSLPPFDVTWTIESILGNLYSTSYGSKRFLGDHIAAFEHDLSNALLAIQPDGVFQEEWNVTVKLGIKR